jgi:hypothetical protein
MTSLKSIILLGVLTIHTMTKLNGAFSNTTKNFLTYSVGYFPKSFPKDPLDFKLFLEHVLVGQVLEPLVSTDSTGRIFPGAAESWEFQNNNQTIIFKLKSHKKFSNGKPLIADDVIFSILRHKENPQSQSHAFLRNLEKIEKIDNHTLRFQLLEPGVALIKILARDQLGILPVGWKLDPKSNEPLIGTGAYRCVRENSQWFLVENPNFEVIQNNLQSIKKWQVLFSDDLTNEKESLAQVDFVPVIVGQQIDQIKALSNPHIRDGKITDQVSFLQSTAWWIKPVSQSDEIKAREIKIAALETLIQSATEASGNLRATGVIPKGVAGHIPADQFEPKQIKSGKFKNKTLFRLGVFSSVNKVLQGVQDLQKIEKQYNLEFVFVESPGDPKLLRDANVDAVLVAYFGGFNDPQGFTFMLEGVVGQKIEKYLGQNLGSKYLTASRESDPLLRAQKFLNFGFELNQSPLFLPGWTFRVASFNSKKLKYLNTQSYSPRFKDIKAIGSK